MPEISVIVPIYRGQKYIEGIISQIERNSEMFHGGTIELVFVNDCPDEKIAPRSSEKISIVVCNSSVNQGIQGARIKGCELCKGKYILLLDQDDRIMDDCIQSQYEMIVRREADVSVCRAMENGRQWYNMIRKFEYVGNRDYMLNHVNPILSPGQVLIKKDAIPSVWKNNLLEHNGADDWLLWFGLLSNGNKFALNEKILYEHIVDGSNTSWDDIGMTLSARDLLKVLKEEKMFESNELQMISEMITNEEFRHMRELANARRIFHIYDIWMNLESDFGDITEHIYHLGYRTISVYGYGYVGRLLTKKILKSSLEFRGAIDMNADFMDEGIEVVTIEQFNKAVELVIVTAPLSAQDFEGIETRLASNTGAKVLTIEELLNEWRNI